MNNFQPPYSYEQIVVLYGKKLADKLYKDPTHRWRMETGLELIHKEPTLDQQKRIWQNWNLMTEQQKKISDKKCLQMNNKTNAELNDQIMKKFWS